MSASAQLSIRGVGSLTRGGDRQVHVSFTAPVGESGESLANYSLNQGTIVSASRLTGLPPKDGYLPSDVENPTPNGRPVDNSVVVLTVSGLTTGEEYELTISGVESADGESTLEEVTETFKATAWEAREIETSAKKGHAIAVGDNGFDLISSGTSFWEDSVEATFVSQPVSGEFDMKARVAFQDISSQWARGGIMMWESFEPENNGAQVSRYVTAHANKARDFNSDGTVAPDGGNNAFESNWRAVRGKPAESQNGGAGGTPEYPNAWVRLTRDGDSFRAFFSSDGEDWEQINGDRSYSKIPSPLHIGPVYSPETANIGDFGQGKNFLMQIRDVTFTTEPFEAVSITQGPESKTVEENQTAALSVETSGSPIRFKWFKDGEVLEGEMDNALSFSPVTMEDAGTYQVEVFNPEGEGETSEEVTLEVTPDQTPPSIRWVASIDGQSIIAQFSEPLDASSAETADNYSVEGVTITGAGLASDNPSRVELATDGLPTGEILSLVVNNVDDSAGVTIEEDSSMSFKAQDLTIAGETPNFVKLPTRRKTPLDSGIERGFDMKIVQNTEGVTSVSEAESQLAGELTDDEGNPLENLASPSEFVEDNTINYSQGGSNAGFLPGDVMFPSVEDTGTDSVVTDKFSLEAKTFLQLEQGVYSMGITSDDGFRLMSGDTVISEFDGTRGPEQNFFEIIAPKDGLYPFRLVYFENTGGNTVEWFVLNDPNPANPQTTLSGINQTDFIKAYSEREAPAFEPATLSIEQTGENEITISWDTTGTLQSASSVTGPWENVTDQTPHTTAPEETTFFRLRQ